MIRWIIGMVVVFSLVVVYSALVVSSKAEQNYSENKEFMTESTKKL